MADPTEPIPFPAWRYHTSGRTCIVEGPAQDAALKKGEAGWGDKPLPPPPNEPEPPAFGATDHAPVVADPPADPATPAPEPEDDAPRKAAAHKKR